LSKHVTTQSGGGTSTLRNQVNNPDSQYSKTTETVHPSVRNLHKLSVYHEDNGSVFNVGGLDNIVLTHGRTYFTISYQNQANLKLKPNTSILFEMIDSRGNIIFTDLAPTYKNIDGSVFGYIEIRENPIRIFDKIADGKALLTIVGELEQAPEQWKGKYNIRYSKELEIRKNQPNTSPVLFKKEPSVSVTEIIQGDKDKNTRRVDNNFKRLYGIFSVDNLSTYGGKVQSVEILYKPSKDNITQYRSLGTFNIDSDFENLISHPSSGSDWVGNFNHNNFDMLNDNWTTSSVLGTSGLTSHTNISSGVPKIQHHLLLGPKYGSSIGKAVSMSFSSHRKTVEDEDFVLKYIPSGSGRVRIYEMSGSNTFNHTTTRTIYERSFSNYDVSASAPLVNNKISSSNNLTEHFVQDDIRIAENKYWKIVVDNTKTTNRLHIADISFKSKRKKGQNPPYIVQKVEIPPLTFRRDDDIDFKFLFLDSTGKAAKDFGSDNFDYTPTISEETFAGVPLTIEKHDNLLTGSLKIGQGTGKAEFYGQLGYDPDKGLVKIFKDQDPTSIGKNTDLIEFDQSGSNSIIHISGSTSENTYLQVLSGSVYTKITPDWIYLAGSNIIFRDGLEAVPIRRGTRKIGVNTPGTTGDGYDLNVYAGPGLAESGGKKGGDLYLRGGLKFGSGTDGDVIIAYATGSGAKGKVGIGNPEPSHTLTVEGDISASGDLMVDTVTATHLSASSITANQYTINHFTSSVLFTSGSTAFGSGEENTHTFSGSLKVFGHGESHFISGTLRASGIRAASFELSKTQGGIYPYFIMRNDQENISLPAIRFNSGSDSHQMGIYGIMRDTTGALYDDSKAPWIQFRSSSIINDHTINFQFGGQNTPRVGIATQSPTVELHVSGSMIATNSASIGTTANSGKTLTVEGDISGSGTGYFGEVVNLTGEDPRLRLKAVGANHPGVEWHEDSTRKWVLYNDPDASDKLVFKNDSTDLIKITQDGALGVSDYIYHINDTDTRITFTGDDINIQAGGVNFIDITEGGTNEITFNEAGAASSVDIDFRVEGTGDANLLFTDAGNDRVGIGTNVPTKKLTVEGDISASGHIYASSAVSINTSATASMSDKGKFSVNYGDGSSVSGSLTVTGHAYGEIVTFGSYQSTVDEGCVIFLNSGSQWEPALGDASRNRSNACSSSLLGISMGPNPSDGILLRGFAAVNASDLGDSKPGQSCYMGGHASGRPFSHSDAMSVLTATGDIVRVVGYVLDASNGIIHFNPDSSWVEVSS
jgi:hypothetical protein